MAKYNNVYHAVTSYSHHGGIVKVMSEIKGAHREACLCHNFCSKFKPGEPDNCPIAQKNFEMCVELNLTTPVWECPEFESEYE